MSQGRTIIPPGTPAKSANIERLKAGLKAIANELLTEDDEVQRKMAAIQLVSSVKSIHDTFSTDDQAELRMMLTPKAAPSSDNVRRTLFSSSDKNEDASEQVKSRRDDNEPDQQKKRKVSHTKDRSTVKDATKKPSKKEDVENKLPQIKIPYSTTITRGTLTEYRSDLIKDLLTSTFDQKISNSMKYGVKFSNEKIHDLVSFVFDDVLGLGLKKRITAIINGFNDLDETSQRGHVGQRAKVLSGEQQPSEIISLLHNIQSQKLLIANPRAAHNRIMKMIKDLELHNAFEAVKSAVESGDEETIRWLSSFGGSTSQGVSKVSILIRALEKSLETSNVHGMLQSANAVAIWVQTFGVGIIGVLPLTAQSQTVDLGFGICRAAIPIIKRHVPVLTTMCELSEKLLILPIQKGEPLKIQDPNKLKHYTIEQLFSEVSNDEDVTMGDVTNEGTDLDGNMMG